MRITKFDRATCKMVNEEAMALLKPLAEKYGLTLGRGAGSFADQTFNMKVTFAATAADGKSADQAEFEKVCYAFGMKPEDWHKTFSTTKGEYRLAGLLPKRSKYCVRGEATSDGSRLLFTEDVLDRIRKNRYGELTETPAPERSEH
jgi:hypothetical protein